MIQTVPFRVTEKEYRQAYFERRRKRFPVPYWLAGVFGLVCVVIGVFARESLLTIVGLALVVNVILLYALIYGAAKVAMAAPMFKRDWTVKFEADRVVANIESGTESVIAYRDITHVEVHRSFLLVFIGPLQYHVVPQRAFAVKSDFWGAVALFRQFGVRVDERYKPVPPPVVKQ